MDEDETSDLNEQFNSEVVSNFKTQSFRTVSNNMKRRNSPAVGGPIRQELSADQNKFTNTNLKYDADI